MASTRSRTTARSWRQGWSGIPASWASGRAAAWFASRVSSWFSSWGETLLAPLFDPLQSPLPRRVRALGLFTAVGHPLFHLLWTRWTPQPYEDPWQRLAMSGLGLVLMVTPALSHCPPTRTATLVTSVIFWITLPVYFTWMYLCNGGNAIWFASAAAMLLIYLNLTDWRLASLGLVTGLPAGWMLFAGFGPDTLSLPTEAVQAQAVVFVFCAATGLMLGMSTSNLRREQLKQALDTMGIMAHELRTPLATMNLIGEAMRQEARTATPLRREQVEHLAHRLLNLVRNMHRQIDTQITNARLLRLPPATESVSAACLLREAMAAHPFRHERERQCVELVVHSDFEFDTVRSLFLQVIDNLLRNALRALASLPEGPVPGDLRVEIDQTSHRWGCIRVIDRGIGIPPHLQARLFQPFVSSHHASGHGLGLAFCQRVVHRCGGRLRVESALGEGATFIIELPVSSVSRKSTAAKSQATPICPGTPNKVL
jgi:two-component system CAI-1 autoinducer sensor kinase/phosphatase CqsS